MDERQAHAGITPHGPGRRSNARSVLAIVCGVLIFDISAGALFALSRVDPHLFPAMTFLIGSTIYGAAFAMLGGYVAARLSTHRPVAHAVGVAIIIGGTALVSMIAEWKNGSVWSELAVLIVMTPAAVMGGLVRLRT